MTNYQDFVKDKYHEESIMSDSRF